MTPRRPLSLDHYVLGPDGRTPVLEENFLEWAKWFERSGESRRVAKTAIPGVGYISTIFLGLDHGWGSRRPVLFETMSFFGEAQEDYSDRYHTWAEAEAGHAEIVAKALAALEISAVMLSDLLVPSDTVEGGEA
jgi:hypothetical protein